MTKNISRCWVSVNEYYAVNVKIKTLHIHAGGGGGVSISSQRRRLSSVGMWLIKIRLVLRLSHLYDGNLITRKDGFYIEMELSLPWLCWCAFCLVHVDTQRAYGKNEESTGGELHGDLEDKGNGNKYSDIGPLGESNRVLVVTKINNYK